MLDEGEEPGVGGKIYGVQIGENLICTINVQPKKKEMLRKQAKAILILDCSGSMGQWVQRSVTAWQLALRAQYYQEEEEVHIIEFEGQTKMTQHKVKDLDSLDMRARGCTRMTGVVFELDTLLNRFKDELVNIWVVSDGHIDDQVLFKDSMRRTLAKHFDSPNISVVGLRLCIGHNDPDVQAMSAVGLLSTRQFQLHDFEATTDSNIVKKLATVMETIGHQEEKVSVSMYYALLMKRPGEEGQKSLILENKDWFVIQHAKAPTEVKINEKVTTVEMFPESETLAVLEKFATQNYSRLMQEKIAGLYDNAKYIEALEGLFVDLDKMTTTVTTELEASSTDMSTTRRALELKKKMAKQQKTVRTRIAELRNLTNFETMSGHMKSDLLRNLGSGKGDIKLMKRFGRTEQGKDPAQMISDAVAACRLALPQLTLEKEQEVREECFFSKESSLESALVAIETLGEFDPSSTINPDSLLTVFGLHGLAIRHRPGNYTDPMLLGLNQGLGDTIHQVYTNVCLNQSVLWYAKENGHDIKAPGFDDVITAVVPIKSWNHPAVWKLYNLDSQMGALQTSAHLRNVLTPLPRDRVAITTSLLLKMMADWAHPTEIQAKMMAEVLKSIQWKHQSDTTKRISAGLEGEEPLAEMSTANNLASDLAPFTQVLCDPSLLAFLAEPVSSWMLWRALVANTIYWTVRRERGDKDRQEVIRRLLGCSTEHSTHTLPDHLEEPESLSFHDQWDEGKANQYVLKLNGKLTKLYQNMFALARAFKAAGKVVSPAVFKADSTRNADFDTSMVGMDFDIFCLVEIVKSLKTSSETERYGQGSIGFHSGEEEARGYLKGVVRDFYTEKYQAELKQKQERVREAKLQQFLLNLWSILKKMCPTRP